MAFDVPSGNAGKIVIETHKDEDDAFVGPGQPCYSWGKTWATPATLSSYPTPELLCALEFARHNARSTDALYAELLGRGAVTGPNPDVDDDPTVEHRRRALAQWKDMLTNSFSWGGTAMAAIAAAEHALAQAKAAKAARLAEASVAASATGAGGGDDGGGGGSDGDASGGGGGVTTSATSAASASAATSAAPVVASAKRGGPLGRRGGKMRVSSAGLRAAGLITVLPPPPPAPATVDVAAVSTNALEEAFAVEVANPPCS